MIKDILNELKMELPATVKLVAVSKFHPFESIVQAYEAGQRVFAESRPQEFLAKIRALEALREDLVLHAKAEEGDAEAARGYMSDIEWHFIGHLQTNKLKMVLPYVSLVQSVDSVRLLDAIDAWGRANGKVIDILWNVMYLPRIPSRDSAAWSLPDCSTRGMDVTLSASEVLWAWPRSQMTNLWCVLISQSWQKCPIWYEPLSQDMTAMRFPWACPETTALPSGWAPQWYA